MILNEYNQILREHFDFSDRNTTQVITKINEAGHSSQLMSALANALYEKIAKKVDKIDFGSIPRSRGDITKVEGFNNTEECLNIIRRLVVEYKENTEIVDTVITAINNMKNLKPLFMKAFTYNTHFPITFYNLTVMAIEQSVSFLIAVTIQYIKDPGTKNITMALDRAAYNDTKSNMLFEQLYKFNKSCAKGEMDSVLRDSLKNGGKISENIEVSVSGSTDDCENKECAPAAGSEVPPTKDDECDPTPVMPINGACDNTEEKVNEIFAPLVPIAIGAAAVLSIVPILKFVIPFLRNIVAWIDNKRESLAESLNSQALLLELNALKIQNGEVDTVKDKESVIASQLKTAEKLRSLAKTIALKNNKAKKDAKNDVDEEKRKLKASDIKDQLPDDIITSGDLF